MPDKMPVIGCMADNGHFYTLVLLFRAGHQPVKVTLIQPILNDTVFLKFTFGKGFCNGSGDLSLISQNLCIVELQKSVQLGGPICHGHTNMDQLYKYCQDMSKSINTKLGIALGGVAVAVIISIISLFI